MREKLGIKMVLAAAGLAAAVLSAAFVPTMMRAQAPAASAPAAADAASASDPAPINTRPNPYKTVADWAKMPAGRTWGATGGVAIDRHGHVWVAERCGANTCAGSNLAPILEFDASGKLLTSFGAGLFVFPHGISVDKDDNIWVTDADTKDGKGDDIIEFSQAGKVLMRLGKPGIEGDGPDTFNKPSAVAFAPNGDIFVADGHGGNNRVVKFTKDGKFLLNIGQKGSGPGDLQGPHALAFDSQGRLWVADRGNNRLEVFDQQGHFISQTKNFSRPSGIGIDKKGTVYVCDSESGGVNKAHGNWTRGIRVGTQDGTVKYFIPDPSVVQNGTSDAEGCAVDAHGVVYGAEVGPKDLKRYVPPKHLS